jgi:O-antigen ligase
MTRPKGWRIFMWNSRTFDYRIWVTLFLSLGFAFVLNILMPVLSQKPAYLLALPVGILFFAVLVIKPKWVLMMLVLLRPLLDNLLNLTRTGSSAGQGVGVGAVLNLAVILLSIFLSFHYAAFPRGNKVVFCWFIFLFLMFLSVCYSPFPLEAMRLYFNYMSYFAMFIIPFLVIKSKKDFLFWLKILAWSFVLPVLCANIDLLHGGRQFEDAGKRIAGTFTHPNILAFYLVLGITLYFYILKSGYLKLKPTVMWSMRILVLNMLVLLIATKTRNAWIACMSVFFIYGLLKDKKFLIIFLLLIPLTLVIPSVKERVLTAISNKQVTDYHGINSFEWRLRMWKSSIPMIEKRPLQGYGLSSFLPMSGKFSDVGANGAHNAYLEMLYEAGIFGLVSFVFLFLSSLTIFFRNLRNSVNQHQAQLWALLVGYVIGYMVVCFGDNLAYYLVLNWYVWFFIGLMLVSEKFSYD